MKNNLCEKIFISSFDKSYSSTVNFISPEKYRDLEKATENFSSLITMGSNLSYSPVSFYEKSISISLIKFNKILSFDYKKKEVTIEAGVKIFDLLNYLLPKGLWIPQLPGHPYITIGGAVAANVHGKSSGVHGTIKNSIKELLLFHKKHGWITLSNSKNKDLFDLTVGGLGLTGTIVSVTLKLQNFNYLNFLTERFEVNSIQETITCLKKYKNDKNLLIYSWNDASNLRNFGRGYIFINRPIDKKNREKIKLKFNNNYKISIPIWNKSFLKIFNNIFFNLQKYTKRIYKESFEKTIFPLAINDNYFNFYGNKGFIESQLIIPSTVIENFFLEFKKFFSEYKPEIILFSFKNISGKQKYIRFEGEGFCVTFNFTRNQKNLNFLNKIDNLCIKYGIIPSIIKDSRISKKVFEKCFSQANQFREDLIKFDKNRIYQSETSKRLGI